MKTKVITVLVLLTISFVNVKSQNLLKDGDFESSVPNGSWPSSGAWLQSWYPNKAGAVATSTAANSGKCGLWIYTSNGQSFSSPHQVVKCKPLTKYKAQAWLRSPMSRNWTKGTIAFVRISFYNKAGHIVKTTTSDSLKTGNTDWKLYSVTITAPNNAVKIKFSINLDSDQGQSIINADECELLEL